MPDAEAMVADILRLMPPTLGNEDRARANLLALGPSELARLHGSVVTESARVEAPARTFAERLSDLARSSGGPAERPGLTRLRRAVADIRRDRDT